tara:strand:- start:172 stop:663 length:492 start_codon:yes stop_codon:yes gene_type:complete
MRKNSIQIMPAPELYLHGWVTLFFIALAIIWGAFVAGLDAGLVYNEFPKMGDGIIPPEMWHLSPAWINIFENIPSVQFTHRWLAITATLVALSLWAHSIKSKKSRWNYHVFGVLMILQVGLGIATLLGGVPIVLAALHQANATAILIIVIICQFKTKPRKISA